MIPYPTTVDFSSEELIFYYSDIHPGNFLIDEDDRICVFDFGDAGFLPLSFMSFVLHQNARSLTSSIAAELPVPKSQNLEAMNVASYRIKIASNPRIGKNGPVCYVMKY
jgi:serine/threonine protein kinase